VSLIRLSQALKSKSNIRCDWGLLTPYPIQQQLLDSKAHLVGFGGSAGGSKTTGLLLAAYLNHTKSLIIRKTYPNLREVIDTSQSLFIGSGGVYNKNDKCWIFPNGKHIEFGCLQYPHERENYRGRAHSGLFIDEVTELPGGLETLHFLSGWVRSTDPEEKTQIICTFNPPSNSSELWILEVWRPWLDPEYPNPAVSGEIRYFCTIKGEDREVPLAEPFRLGFGGECISLSQDPDLEGEVYYPISRTFIRAQLRDNPGLSATTYRQTLENLPEPLRSQLLLGKINFNLSDSPNQLFPSEWIRLAFDRYTANSKPLTESPRAVGVDVARGGDNFTTCTLLYSGYWVEQLIWTGRETPDGQSIGAIILNCTQGGDLIGIDVGGVGASAYDFCKHIRRVIPISGAETSDRADKTGLLGFYNYRAELFWLLREALDPLTGLNLCLPPSTKLHQELGS